MPTSADELAGVVATARKATEDLDDAELQRVAFERVLDHLLRNGGDRLERVPDPTVIMASTDATTVSKADSVLADEQQRTDAIARYFKIDPEDVGHIFDTSANEPELIVHTSRLDNSSAVATRDITLLTTGARTAIGLETTTHHVRSVSDNFSRLDSSNFMKTLGSMTEISVLGRRGSPNRVIRMKVSGVERAQELVKQLISG